MKRLGKARKEVISNWAKFIARVYLPGIVGWTAMLYWSIVRNYYYGMPFLMILGYFLFTSLIKRTLN